MKTLGISGWLQPAEALQDLYPGIDPFRYNTLPDMRAAAQALAALKPEAVIGWSLGGVLAAQALLHPYYRPRKLVMMGSPFQYLASDEVPEGVSLTEYQALRMNYKEEPKRLARRLQGAINRGVAADCPLCPVAENYADKVAWLPWLEHLAATSFVQANFVHQPEVLVIHGGLDEVIAPAQAKYWQRIFPKVQVLMLSEASHAPHLQATALVQQAVAEFLDA